MYYHFQSVRMGDSYFETHVIFDIQSNLSQNRDHSVNVQFCHNCKRKGH